MNQTRLLGAELFGAEAVPLEVTRTLIGKEDVGVLQQVIEFGAILFGAIEDGLTHPDLHVPIKPLNLGISGPPDVEDIGPVLGEVSSDAGSGDNMPHSESTDTVQRTLCTVLEMYRFAYTDLHHPDQRHSGKHVDVLSLLPELVESTDLRHHDPGLCCGPFEVVGAPLPNGVPYGFRACATLEQAQRAGGQLG